MKNALRFAALLSHDLHASMGGDHMGVCCGMDLRIKSLTHALVLLV
jgi:hypothetical protein